MRAWSVLLTPFMVTACASAPPVTPQVVDVDTRDLVEAQAAPDLPPWMIAAQWAVIGEVPAGLSTGGDLMFADAEGITAIYRPVARGLLPEHLRGLIGQRLAVVSDKGVRGCEAVISEMAVGVFLTDSDAGYHALFEEVEYDEEGNIIREVPAQERYAGAVEGRSFRLFTALTDVSGEPFEGCAKDDFIAHHVTPVVGRPMALSDAAAPLRAKVVAAFREHGFWEIQQTNFQKSVEALRKQSREAYEAEVAAAKKSGASATEIAEIYRDDRADQARATWDVVDDDAQGDAYNGNYVAVWRDKKGSDRFAVAIIGNDQSCAAPRSWMLFGVDGDQVVTLDFGIRGPPTGVVEHDDGTIEALFGTWDPRSIRRVDGDDLITRREHAVSASLHCSHGQIPPLVP